LPELPSSHHELLSSHRDEVSPSVAERIDGRAARLSADVLPLTRGGTSAIS
jgi:hypothetical protein